MRRGLYIRYEENMKCLKILVGKGRCHLEDQRIDEVMILKAGYA
jgi:hypothetical protein